MRFFNTIFIGISLSSLLHAGHITHCNDQENIIFSCEVGKKMVSICLNKQKEFSYRFGAIGKPELFFVNKHPTGDTLMFSGGGGAYLRLSNQNYNYIVYTGIGKGWEKEGLSLEKNGRFIKKFECKNPALSDIGPELFEKYQIKSDNGFDIP